MPYLLSPLWARVTESTARTLMYVMIFLAGFASVFLTPQTITGVVGSTMLTVSGCALMLASVPAVLGAALRKYQLEWSAIWVIVGSSVTYVTSVWTLVNTDTLTRLTQSSFVTVAFLALIIRAVNLTVIANRNREMNRIVEGG